MNWVDIIILLILIFSFIGGVKEGAVKNLFTLAATIIAIPVAGSYYYIIANFLDFLPGNDWQNFIAFFVAMGIIVVILHLIFIIPRKIIEQVWSGGILFRLIGGAANVVNAGIGLVILAIVIKTYPIVGWLEEMVVNSALIAWLATLLGFVVQLLPPIFHRAANFI
ncbi:MAG: CvpA family protein [Dehalococcoidales bacterium]|nr:CvpA family protein [Dehalococcoidales bacterium]